MLATLAAILVGPTLREVGAGKAYASVQAAVTAAQPGDTIRVFRRAEGYRGTAVRVSVPRLNIESEPGVRVELNGAGFDYSGVGDVPRGIFQFEPTASGCSLQGFVLRDARNTSHNAAGVRINGAPDITIRQCEIAGNDMGIMSGGATAARQIIEDCQIFANGCFDDPGFNHNLYLGGMSATVRRCQIFNALTGHDLKSRAHYLRVESCLLYGAANREVDLVEADETRLPNSNAVLIDNLITKRETTGNGNVLHFGRERGERNGALWLIGNTIETESISPVLTLSDRNAIAHLEYNVINCTGHGIPTFTSCANGALESNIFGSENWISLRYLSDRARALRMERQPALERINPAAYDMRRTIFIDGDGQRHTIRTQLGARNGVVRLRD